jgi:xylan 1,4-beta-xylosidase
VMIQRLDDNAGNVLKVYAAMGAPLDPTAAQVEQMNRATALPVPTEEHLVGGKLAVKLTPNSLVLIKVQP